MKITYKNKSNDEKVYMYNYNRKGIYIGCDEHEKLKVYCEKNNKSMYDVVNSIINKYIREEVYKYE